MQEIIRQLFQYVKKKSGVTILILIRMWFYAGVLSQINSIQKLSFGLRGQKKISQYDHRVIEVLAEAKYYQGKNNDALALFQEYLSLVPLNADRAGTAFYLMGEIFIRQAKFEHADIALTQAVKIEPLRSAWWVRLAYAREMTRGYAKALLAYEQALSLSPFLEDAVNGRERVKKLIR